MPNRPNHVLMLAPTNLLDGASRIIHTVNALCEEGIKVSVVCRPQRNDNAQKLKSLLHDNACVYVALASNRQILNFRLVSSADHEHLPYAQRYELISFFQESAGNQPENTFAKLRDRLVGKLPKNIGRVFQSATDRSAAAGLKYLDKILPPHLYKKYKDLFQLHGYNYFFLIQGLIIHNKIEPIDAVFCHDLWSLPIGCIMKELFGMTLLYDSHEIGTCCLLDPTLNKIAFANEKWMYELCDSFMTVSDACAKYYQDLCPSLRPLVITNAHRLLWERPAELKPLKQRLSVSEDAPLAVYVGNLFSVSQIDRFIEALPQCQSNLHLALIGDRGDIERYKKLVEKLKLDERVFFLGRVDYEDVFATIYGADFGIIPNVQNHINPGWAILSSKLFDYVQAEMPFITDYGPEIQKVLDQYRIGQVVDFQKKPPEIAKMLDEFYARVTAGEFDEVRRAKESFAWPKDVVDQMLNARPESVTAQPKPMTT
jgi:Glycosyltransferase